MRKIATTIVVAIALVMAILAGSAAARRPRRSIQDLGESCTDDSDCDSDLVCSDGQVCACPNGTASVNGECKGKVDCENCTAAAVASAAPSLTTIPTTKAKGLGATCNVTSDCDSSLSLTCQSGECRCPSGRDPHPNGDSCLATAERLGDKCESPVQCTGVKGTCSTLGVCVSQLCDDDNAELGEDYTCHCIDGYVSSPDDTTCLSEAMDLGDECSVDGQCTPVNGSCVSGVCVKAGLSAVVASLSDVSVGVVISSACDSDINCSVIGHAICKESVCQCEEGYIASPDDKECLPFARKVGDACQVDKQCSKVSGATCVDGKCAKVHAAGMKASTTGNGARSAGSMRFILAVLIASSAFVLN